MSSAIKYCVPMIAKEQRLISLDALRGLLMVLMAVDHANYFVARMHPTGSPPIQVRLIGFFLRYSA